jgi:hypothetical protein
MSLIHFNPTAKIGWEVLPHPSYSPDLAPSDYLLLGFVKGQLHRQRFETREAIQKAVHQSSDGWNGILQKGNFHIMLGEKCPNSGVYVIK